MKSFDHKCGYYSVLGLDFIGNRKPFYNSDCILHHQLNHLSYCGISVGPGMGGDEHIGKAEERMISAKSKQQSPVT